MTTITSPTEVSVTDLPMSVKSGTGKRRALVVVRLTSEGTADTIGIGNFLDGFSSIEGLMWDTVAGSVAPTSTTFAGGTSLTTAQGAGAYEMGVWVNLT